MAKYPKSQCIYLSLTFDSAKQILMPALQELNQKYQLGCKFTDSKMTHPNGAKLVLMGADQKNFVKRLKGRKHPGVAVDEAQDFGSHLQTLVYDVLSPCIADYSDGWIALTGTPGPVPQGFFFDITEKRKFGYSVHAWTVLDNPYMPDPSGFINTLIAKNEWADNNPTLLREWRNHWVLDVQSLWIKYSETVNHFQALPERPKNDPYTYLMGIDLGFKDADAIAILAWHEKDPCTYLVEEKITAKQGITELVKQVEDLAKKYDIAKMVIDEGGLGKKIAEEMRRQKAIPVHQADKARKQENVEFLNDALRTGKFKAKGDSRFAKDSYLVQIDWDKSTHDRIVVKKNPHSDIIDAVLYAFKESPAYAYTAPKKTLIKGTKEWADSQADHMFEAAQEHFQEQADLERRFS